MDKERSHYQTINSSTASCRIIAASFVLHSYRLVVVLCLLLSHRSVSGLPSGRIPGTVGIQGIPVCPVGLPACGLHGCYTPLLSQCDPGNGCISIKLFSQLSAVVRFGGTIKEHIGSCPIGFANACGDLFCAMGDLCIGGTCRPGSAQKTEVVGHSGAQLKAACLAARHSVAACAGDTSELVSVDCNGIGVASIKSISCFQSQLFNCAVRPGSSATFSCRGIAGVAQAVTDAWNTTISGAAAMAVEVASAISKQEHQHASEQAQILMVGQPAGVLPDPQPKAADPYGSSTGTHRTGGSSSAAQHGWRAGANAAWDKLGQAVQDGQPLLQPVFQSLANIVTNASKSLLNITSEMGSPAEDKGKIAGAAIKQPTFDLGTPPIRDAAGAAPQHLLVIMTVRMHMPLRQLRCRDHMLQPAVLHPLLAFCVFPTFDFYSTWQFDSPTQVTKQTSVSLNTMLLYRHNRLTLLPASSRRCNMSAQHILSHGNVRLSLTHTATLSVVSLDVGFAAALQVTMVTCAVLHML